MKRPAFQWYPGDARRDTALQSCSLVVRGLWREMLDLMHFGEPYGHLTSGGVPISVEELARMVGESATKVRRWVAELEAKKVLSRTETGVIYSRRMVKDEHIREVRAAVGHLGGSRSHGRAKDAGRDAGGYVRDFAQAKSEQTYEQGGEQEGPPASASASASALAIEPSVVSGAAVALVAVANRALAESPHEHVRRRHAVPRLLATSASTHEAAIAILAAGVPQEFATESVAEIARTCSLDRGVSSLNYFVDGVVRAWKRHQAGEDAAAVDLPPPRARSRRAAARPNPGEQTYANALVALGLTGDGQEDS